MYTLEYLIEKFLEHEKRAEQTQKELIAQFIENNPGEPLPEWFKDDFNLPGALSSVCAEVLALKHAKGASACADE
jgi:hypothetical protein